MRPALQARLLSHGRWRTLARGDNLMLAGEETGGLYGIGSGVVSSISMAASHDITMSDLHIPPFWFITQTMLPRRRTAMNVVAQSSCEVMFVPQSSLAEIIVEFPDFRPHIFLLVADLFHRMTEALSDSLIRDPDRRCIAVLLRIAGQRYEGSGVVNLPLGQTDLAAMTNVSRQKIGDVLRSLDEEGIVQQGYREISVVDSGRLRAMLED